MTDSNLPDKPEEKELEVYKSPFEDGLDQKCVAFYHQYALDMNPQAAAARHGITLREARSMLRKEGAEKCIADIHSHVLEKCGITLEQTLNEISRIAFFDVKGVVKRVTESGVEFHNWDDIDGRAIAEVKQMHTKDGITYAMIKPHRKVEALKVLLEYFKDTPSEQHLHIHTNEVKAANPEAAMDFFNELLENS